MRTRHVLLALCLLAPAGASAQVVLPPTVTDIETDGSFGPQEPVGGVGGTYTIPETLGRRADTNLFHSFLAFDLAKGDTALFTADPANLTENVLARVTSGSQSRIFGTLASDIDGAALWFLNPAGVFFGDGAALDLMGSFHASSADVLRFSDGFDLETGACSPAPCVPPGLVTAASPMEFGFTSPEPGPIQLVGVDQFAFRVDPDETISLVGGDVFVDGPLEGGVTEALGAPDGTIQIASVKGSGIDTDPNLVDALDLSQFDVLELPDFQLGTIQLGTEMAGAKLDVSGSGADPGKIVIRGGRLVMVGGSQLVAGNLGGGDPGAFDSIDVQALDVEMVGGEMTSSAFDTRAGDVRVRGDTLTMEAGALIRSALFNFGANASGGDVSVTFDESISLSGVGGLGPTQISSKTLSPALAKATGGSVEVTTGQLSLDDGAAIATLTEGANAEKAGFLHVVADTLTLTNGSLVATSPLEPNPIFGGSGLAGGLDLEIDAAHVIVESDSKIAATGFGDGNAGNVVIENGDGMAESIRVTGGGESFTRITARTDGDGAAGSVTLRTKSLVVEQGGVVTTSATGDEPAGDVIVEAEVVTVRGVDPDTPENRSAILAITSGTGAAGKVDITASKQLTIADGGQLSVQSDNVSSGASGGVEVVAGNVDISGSEDAVLASSLSADQPGGNIDISATGNVRIEGTGDTPTIRTESRGASGGNITIEADRKVEILGAGIVADAELSTSDSDNAGRIRIAGAGVLIAGGSQLSAKAGAQAQGGFIEVDTPVFLLPGGVLLETSPQAGGGVAVAVQASNEGAGRFESLFGDVLDVSSKDGTTGEVDLQAPESQLTAQVAALPSNYLDIDRLAANQCEAREGPAGSLVVQGRDRAPRAPDEEVPVLYLGTETK